MIPVRLQGRVAMSRTHSVDVLESDRGLRSCFQAANILPAWGEEFSKVHRTETLDDFVFMVRQDKWEDSVEEMVDKVPSVKGNQVALARFKAAFECGSQAIKLAAAVNPKTTEELDTVLPEATMATVSRDFKAKYGFDVEAALEPADSLRSRLYREFRKGTMSVIEVKKIKSVLTQSGPKLQESVQLPGGLHLQFDRDSPTEVSSSISYYFALRVLSNAWAWAGNFKHKDQDGTEKVFITLGECLTYCDESLRSTMEFGGGSMSWYSKNDLLCRGKMASYIRRGWSGTSALKMALQDTHLEWRAPALQRLADPSRPKRVAEPENPPPDPKRRALKADVYKTVSMVKGGKKLCKKWNDGRGCSDPNCKDIHACDIKLESGKACLKKDHNRLAHHAE